MADLPDSPVGRETGRQPLALPGLTGRCRSPPGGYHVPLKGLRVSVARGGGQWGSRPASGTGVSAPSY